MKQKFGIISDLHMEFWDWDFVPEPDVHYLCAGDIDSNRWARSLFVEKHKDHMTWIRGNHDFYGSSFEGQLPGKTVEVNGFTIASATLWTDLTAPLAWFDYIKGLVDSRYIDNLLYDDYTALHSIQKTYLLNSDADVIMSHHAPSYKSVAEKYRGSPYNPAFASELGMEILELENPPKLWVHGHVHDDFDYNIGSTRVVCHPRGYPNERAEYNFDPYVPKIVTVEK